MVQITHLIFDATGKKIFIHGFSYLIMGAIGNCDSHVNHIYVCVYVYVFGKEVANGLKTTATNSTTFQQC